MNGIISFLCIIIACVCNPIQSSFHLLTIPWPSGILLSDIEHNGIRCRIGRLQYSAISIRPQWQNPQSMDEVLPKEFCRQIILDAESYASRHGWTTTRHLDYPTVDIPLNSIYELSSDFWTEFNKVVKSKILPGFALGFGINSTDIRISDLFIAKYDSANPLKNYLSAHKDKFPWSFVIALNDEYSGGGTFFEQLGEVWKVDTGSLLLFHGQQSHGGLPVTAGTRYIVAGFCEYGEDTHERFLQDYQALHDGHAAAAGFRTGDIVRELQVCREAESDTVHTDTQARARDDDVEDEDHQSAVMSSSSSIPPATIEAVLNTCDQASASIQTCTSKTMRGTVTKQMVAVDGATGAEWRALASSCERLAPGAPTVMLVERLNLST